MTGSIEIEQSTEIRVIGPLKLEAPDLRLVSWIAKQGSEVVGSVKLAREHDHVATLRELHIAENACQSHEIATKLIEHATAYARDHGVLKLKVHQNTAHEWVARAIARTGFKDAATRPTGQTPMQFYLDLYHETQKRERRPEAHKGTMFRIAC